MSGPNAPGSVNSGAPYYVPPGGSLAMPETRDNPTSETQEKVGGIFVSGPGTASAAGSQISGNGRIEVRAVTPQSSASARGSSVGTGGNLFVGAGLTNEQAMALFANK